MYYHIITTQNCNLNCTYCGNEPTDLIPLKLMYSVDTLKEFLSQDTTPKLLAFYGGEPIMEYRRILEIMDSVENTEFAIQTNGTLIERIPSDYIRRFHSILMSIDGDEIHTDQFRGKNTYSKVLAGVKYIKDTGYAGELIARMTITEGTDVYKQVRHLYDLNQFRYIHWQLDAMWGDIDAEHLKDYVEWLKDYNEDIRTLADWWVSEMEEQAIIPGIAPFMGIMHSLLSHEPAQLRCGSGINFFSILTDGTLTACPIPPAKELYLGNIKENTPESIANKIKVDGKCADCDILDVCGGRCLYTNKTQHWGDYGYLVICETVQNLVEAMRDIQDRVQKLIEKGYFRMNDFKYPKIPNGVEIIP